jgi:phage baseplate assembly protein gpV
MRAGLPATGIGHDPLCGVYYGEVTQNKDDDGLARVKLKFPWLPNSDQDQSHWAHLAVPMAGHEFGTFTLPEVGDIVMVMFLAGDIRFPIVVGGAWSETDNPPETNEDGKNNYRLIKSRAGHRLLFDDSPGKIKIALIDRTDSNFVGCGHFPEGADSPNKFELKAPSGDKGVAIASMEGDVDIHCPKGKFSVASKGVEMTTEQACEIKAGGELTLEGGQMQLSSTGEGKYEGSSTSIGP